MTNVIVNAIDVLGQEIDEGVVRISAADAQYNGGSLMLPEYHEQELVAGSTTITGVTSGKVVVTLHWDINRTATFRVFVPDTTEITLAELALQKYDSDPAVVSKVADAAVRAEDAADRAGDIADDFGSLEAVTDLVQTASDAASSASSSKSAAASSASAAATSESNAAGSASSAGASASSAASSASAAAGSASTASGAAASAAGSESQAASSATAAASSASAAASSASTAEDAAERAETGAATVGDAQAILAARDQAVTAKDGAVTAQTAAEAAATSAASAAATEVNKLKAGAPAAFDTLLEIANELGENETERAALANSIAGKADAEHTHSQSEVEGLETELAGKADADHVHTSEDITDARTWTGRSTDSNAIVKTDADGWFFVGNSPTHGSHPTNKSYVDGGLAGKANTSHTHTISQITDMLPLSTSTTHENSIPYRTAGGAIAVPTASITTSGSVTNKAYVDGRTPEIRVVTTIPASPTPGVVYLKFG